MSAKDPGTPPDSPKTGSNPKEASSEKTSPAPTVAPPQPAFSAQAMREKRLTNMGFNLNTSTLYQENKDKSMEEMFRSLLQDANGDNVYDSLRVQIGHIEASKFLMIPETLVKIYERNTYKGNTLLSDVSKIQETNSTDYSGVAARKSYKVDYAAGLKKNDGKVSEEMKLEMIKLQLVNYMSLTKAGLKQESAMIAAFFRTRIAAVGGIKTLLVVEHDDDTAAEFEIVYMGDTDYGKIVQATDIAELLAALPTEMKAILDFAKKEETGASWVTEHTEHLVAATEYAFRVRGHHYKSKGKDAEAYDNLYKRFMEASFEGNFAFPNEFVMEDIFHTAIHPFKVRTLVALVHHFAMTSKLSEAALMRLSGAPAGHAVITTTMAALDTMAGEIWYPTFSEHFKGLIAICKDAKDQILANKYAYHQSAALYGVEKKVDFVINEERVSVEAVKSKIAVLAAACQGLISALNSCVERQVISGFALSNARALEKASKNAPLMTLKIQALITTTIEQIGNTQSIAMMTSLALSKVTEEDMVKAVEAGKVIKE